MATDQRVDQVVVTVSVQTYNVSAPTIPGTLVDGQSIPAVSGTVSIAMQAAGTTQSLDSQPRLRLMAPIPLAHWRYMFAI
jgi:hypothetical protein